MTYIFSVMTNPRRGNTLDGVVSYRDPDNYGFDQGPVFGLQLLMDAWKEGGDFGAGAVSAETAAEFEDLFRLFLSSDYEGNDPVEIKRRAAVDNAEFVRRTDKIIVSWEIEPEDEEDAPDSGDGEKTYESGGGDSAYFTLQVSDPRYLEHLEKSAYFETVFSGLLRTF